ncbi:MAG TPA: hypothetical protein VLT47_05745 [Anaeromyxobacteraceae bacterium]|nr:hypothetical protein [Anaeromyxobacteraceae bacterium]
MASGAVGFGEILHRLAGVLRAEGGGWRESLAAVLSPMGALNRGAARPPGALAAPPSRWQLSLGAVAVEGMGDASGPWRALGQVGFTFVYGLPGSREPELTRPFDHFVLETAWGAAADPVATVRARGLLAGRTFDLDPVRGLYGLYLSFDLDTPPRHQVSTSAVGFGGSARGEVGGGMAVEADAVASAVVLGAGSRVDRGPDAGDRDYRFGPGEQAYAALRLVAGTRGSAGVAVRQVLLWGAGSDAGSTELLVEGSASAVLRIAGPHGIGVEASRQARRARAEGAAPRREDDTVLRFFYALLGGVGRSGT